MSKPKTMSQICCSAGALLAAPAIASTLSRLITMSAMATILTASQSVLRAATLSSLASSCDQQLDRDPEQQQPADQLSHGMSSRYCMTDREDDAQSDRGAGAEDDPPARWRRGSARQASAMTTALSPESTMLMPMIFRTASAVPALSPNTALIHCGP